MKKSDLERVKEIACAMLMTPPQIVRDSPTVVLHPFTSSSSMMAPKNGEWMWVDIARDKEGLKAWQEFMGKVISHAKTPYEVYMMFEKSYALTFLKQASPYLSADDFSKILGRAWVSSKYARVPYRDEELNDRILASMFEKADPSALMLEDEYEQFNGLEDTVTVYRCAAAHDPESIPTISWVLEQESAERYANQDGEDVTVYEARIDKKHIFALFNGKSGTEVVVDPKYLMDITEVQEMQSDVSMTMMQV